VFTVLLALIEAKYRGSFVAVYFATLFADYFMWETILKIFTCKKGE